MDGTLFARTGVTIVPIKMEAAMGLVYFGVVTVALLALERLIGHKGSFGGRPTRLEPSTVGHAA